MTNRMTRRTSFVGRAFLAVCGGLLFLLQTTAVHAQIGLVGGNNVVANMTVLGVDAVFDPSTNGYLVLGGFNQIVAQCTDSEGRPTGGPFVVEAPVTGASDRPFARAAYSPHVNNGNGGFLVVWVEEAPGGNQLHARIVSCSQGAVGTEYDITGGYGAFMSVELGPGVAYSPVSGQFLVAWKSLVPDIRVAARLVDLNGAPVGAPVLLSSGFARNPSVAWNSDTNEFGISFSGESGDTSYSAFVKASASNLAAFVRNTFNIVGGTGRTTITDVAYNPNTRRYVMAWFDIATGLLAKTAEFDANANLQSITVASSKIGSYDALSMAYNPVSGSHLLVGLDIGTDSVVGAELNGSGSRITIEQFLSTTAPPARYPRVGASRTSRTWNTVWSAQGYRFIADQVIATGGSAPPPGGGSNPRMSLDSPANGATVAGGFAIQGWAIDLATTSGTGVDAVHAWAYPVAGGTPLFLGGATLGFPRPDVGATYGAQFTPSGFQLATALPAGTYNVAVYGHSTVTGTFTSMAAVQVNALAPPSMPLMWVDAPEPNQFVSQNVTVVGWAIDFSAGAGTGVDAVHVWGYPVAGGAPIWVGSAVYGQPRPDVAAVFADARFMNSGFVLTSTMPKGEYNLVVYGRSTVTGTFNNYYVLHISVM